MVAFATCQHWHGLVQLVSGCWSRILPSGYCVSSPPESEYELVQVKIVRLWTLRRTSSRIKLLNLFLELDTLAETYCVSDSVWQYGQGVSRH